jgi:hypothetical protein
MPVIVRKNLGKVKPRDLKSKKNNKNNYLCFPSLRRSLRKAALLPLPAREDLKCDLVSRFEDCRSGRRKFVARDVK